jgi:uncharacterized membrane protein
VSAARVVLMAIAVLLIHSPADRLLLLKAVHALRTWFKGADLCRD